MKCPECNGEGKVESSIPAHVSAGVAVDEQFYEQKCLDCDGTGEVEEENQPTNKSMSQIAPKYAIKVSLINEEGDETNFEIVPTVSYEQGAEAVARMVSYFEKKQAEAEQRAEDREEE